MARRKSKARTLQPAVMKLNFRVPANSLRQYIDISECLSRVNRRFYRQGMNWAVANVRMSVLPAAAGAPTVAYVNSLPHTWSTANSWVKAYNAWKSQQDDAIAAMGGQSGVGAFRDFKIFADSDHVAQTFANNLDPYTLGPGTIAGPPPAGLQTGTTILPAEEWLHSQVVIPNDGAPGVTGEYSLHMVGASAANSKGIINGYEFSRSYPQSPDPATPQMSTSWLNRMHDVGDDNNEIIDNAEDRNDELPYDQNAYPGGGSNFDQLECQGYVLNTSTVGVSTFNTGPFTAPCGLIRLDFNGQTASNEMGYYNIVTIELVPGKHRGYLAETMEAF